MTAHGIAQPELVQDCLTNGAWPDPHVWQYDPKATLDSHLATSVSLNPNSELSRMWRWPSKLNP